MFNASFLLGFLGVVPAIKGADEVASDAAKAFKLAFFKPLFVVGEVFLHDFVVSFLADEFHADFDEAGDVHGFVLVELLHSLFDLLVADFSVFRKGIFKALEVEILDFVRVIVDDFLHGFLSEDVSVVISITCILLYDAICGGVNMKSALYVEVFHNSGVNVVE